MRSIRCCFATRSWGLGRRRWGSYAPALLADFYPESERNRILTIFYTAIPGGGGDRIPDRRGGGGKVRMAGCRSMFQRFQGLLDRMC